MVNVIAWWHHHWAVHLPCQYNVHFLKERCRTNITQRHITLHMGNARSWSQENIWHSWRLSFEMITKTARVSHLNCQSARSSYNFQHNPMKLWEMKLNFAVYCATSGLGVSTDHLNAEQPLVKALYKFHTYYHVKQILKRMSVPTPSEDGFDKSNNAFSLEQVRRIGNEYCCSTNDLDIYRNKYYFDRSGVGSHVSYERNNWIRWIMNTSYGFTKYGL